MARPTTIKDGKRPCPQCGKTKPLDGFDKLGGKRKHLYDSFCRECRRKYANKRQRTKEYREKQNANRRTEKYRQKERVYSNKYYKQWTDEQRKKRYENGKRYAQTTRAKEMRARNRRAIKLEFIQSYGGQCKCCGEKRFEFLTIEHVNGGGRQERKKVNTEHLLRKLKREGWPQDGKYSLLCFNCNQARGAFGYCPHEKEK